MTIDFQSAADALRRTAYAITDDQLDHPTPCEGRTVGQLLQHIVGLTGAFRAAGEKDLGEWTDANPDAGGWPQLEEDWQSTLAERLPAMVHAWHQPEAWTGTTRAGGVDLPGEVAGLVALDELVLHGWDLARATGQDYTCDEDTAQALLGFVSQFDAGGTPGLFGPAVPVGPDAPLFDQVLARSGRDPQWSPR